MKHFVILILAVVASAVVMAYPERDSAKDGNQEKERALLVKVQERYQGNQGDYDEYDQDETTPPPDPTAQTARPRLRQNQD
uniref:Thrombin inhibitor madanin 2 n=1 Tax=Haemaphysalis longicornis TaxID=44386 RepID=Q86FP8_HAELO|nr:thrombin inhibitor madanin 2 [Haemaphysalis longicornis]